MSNDLVSTIKDVWKRNKLGTGMFVIGVILCIIGAIFFVIWKINFVSFSDKTPYVIIMILLGVPFVLTGINVMLRSPKSYEGFYKRYIGKNDTSIIQLFVSIMFTIMLFVSYPDGWDYPTFYIIIIPYLVCTLLLTTNIFFIIDNKEKDLERTIKELEESRTIIKEKDNMSIDDTVPDYTIEFANGMKKNIEELKSIMDDLKVSIDLGTKGISDRVTKVINKYRSDNDQLHNDVQKFKQRVEKENEGFKERTNERMIKSLMNTLDNMDELISYKDRGLNYTANDVINIKGEILNILKNEGVDIIKPFIGNDFDDKKCCALQTVETKEFSDKKIVSVKKIGYMFNSGKVLRYADVVVSKGDTIINECVGADTKIAIADIKAENDEIEENLVDINIKPVNIKEKPVNIKEKLVDINTDVKFGNIDVNVDTKSGGNISKSKSENKVNVEGAKLKSGDNKKIDEKKPDDNKKIDEKKPDDNSISNFVYRILGVNKGK